MDPFATDTSTDPTLPTAPEPVEPPTVSDPWAKVPDEGTAYVYTTDPRYLSNGATKALAPSGKVNLPFQVEDLSERFGGGDWLVMIKNASGLLVTSFAEHTLGPDLIAQLFKARGIDVSPVGAGGGGRGVLGLLHELEAHQAATPAVAPGPSPDVVALQAQVAAIADGLQALTAQLAAQANAAASQPHQPSMLEELFIADLKSRNKRDTDDVERGKPASVLSDLKSAMDLVEQIRPASDEDMSVQDMIALGQAFGFKPADQAATPPPAQQPGNQVPATQAKENVDQTALRAVAGRLLQGIDRAIREPNSIEADAAVAAGVLQGLFSTASLAKFIGNDREANIRGTLAMLAQASPASAGGLKNPAAAAYVRAVLGTLDEWNSEDEPDEEPDVEPAGEPDGDAFDVAAAEPEPAAESPAGDATGTA